MEAGFIIYGDSGTVQIDDTYPNLALLKKGTATLTDTGNEFTQSRSALITVTGETPMIAWTSNFPVFLAMVSKSGSTYTFRLMSTNAYDGYSFTYYVFDRPVDSGSTSGVQVFDSAGRLTFDSGRKYLRVMGVGNHDINTSGTVSSYPGTRTYAVTTMQATLYAPVTWVSVGATWTSVLLFQGASTASNGYTYGPLQVASAFGSSSQLPSYPSSIHGKIMLIDVTHY